MIAREKLKGSYSEGEAMALYRELQRTGDFRAFALAYMHDEDYQVARNALWALTKATDQELTLLDDIRDELIDLSMQTENSSVRRLSLNVIERLKMKEEDLRVDFLEYCFGHMVSMDEYPGTQTLCMKLAYRMCAFYPELMGELMRMLDAMEIDYYKPAVKCLHRRILSGKYKE